MVVLDALDLEVGDVAQVGRDEGAVPLVAEAEVFNNILRLHLRGGDGEGRPGERLQSARAPCTLR